MSREQHRDIDAPAFPTGKNFTALYNTDLLLWQKKRESLLACPNGGALLEVKDGHICDGLQVLARFPDDATAEATLVQAGFDKTPRGFKAVTTPQEAAKQIRKQFGKALAVVAD